MINKNPFEQATQFSEITASIVKRTSDCSLENMNALMNVSSRHLKSLGTTKGVEEFLNLANDMSATYLNCSQRAFNVALENFAEISQWLENNAKVINPLQAAKTFTEKAEKSGK